MPPSLSSIAIPPARVTVAEALHGTRDTGELLIGPGKIARIAELFRKQFPGARAVVVADPTTWQVAGSQIQTVLTAAGLGIEEPFLFDDPDLHAEHCFVETLESSLHRHHAIPVAVGSGTINDLVKLASHRTGRRYLCVATAASMDGYTSFGASITFRGAKQTFSCPAPQAVIADTEIIRQAPPAMTAAGYADLQAKIVAGADWVLADALEVEAIDPPAWSMVQGGLPDALADPAGARAGRADAIHPLIEGLMLGGFAMQATSSSRPASGAEHQFSHLWDMEHHTHRGAAPAHGFKVGIATLAMATLYERLLEHPLLDLDIDRCCAHWPSCDQIETLIRQRFAGTDFIETAVQETLAKHPAEKTLRTRLLRLKSIWPDLQTRLARQLLPATELRHRLLQVGAPTAPEEIGLTRARLRESFQRAYHIRRRFTVLDLAVQTGLLQSCLDDLFAPTGAWGTSS